MSRSCKIYPSFELNRLLGFNPISLVPTIEPWRHKNNQQKVTNHILRKKEIKFFRHFSVANKNE